MPDRIRTYDLLLRKQTLYPAELRVHTYGMSLAFRAFDTYVDVLINRDIHLEIKWASLDVTLLLYHILGKCGKNYTVMVE